MDVWVVEWHKPVDNDINTTVWDIEAHALISACADILDSINNDWSLDDDEVRERAEAINDQIHSAYSTGVNAKYMEAIHLYNEWQSDVDYDYQGFFSVYKRQVQNTPASLNYTVFPDPDQDDEDEEEECDEEEEEESFLATVVGTTCRGSCSNYNPDAYADKPDGTYCCYSCRMGLSS